MTKKSFSEVAGEVAYELFVPGYVKVIRSAMSDAQGDMKSAEGKGITELELEAAKQKIVMEFQSHQARVSQEVAIAERISTSSEVEITEYYDVSGKGHAGVSANEASISAGVGGEGRKVTHRVIKFTGFSNPSGTLDG
jgi:ribosomal protein L3